jgi:WD40 repeat protein
VIRLIDLKRGNESGRLEGHTAPVSDVAVSPDGRRALSCSADGEARLWDLRDRKELRRLGDPDLQFRLGVFSPDGRQVLTASTDHVLRLWDVATGAERQSYKGHTHTVRSLAFAPDGTWALSCGGDVAVERGKLVCRGCSIILWDVRGGKEVLRFNDPADLIDKVAISPNGRFAVSVRRVGAGAAILWDLGPVPR